MFRYVADLVDRPRPKVCLLPTAASAVPVSVMRFLSVFPAEGFEPTFLDLFVRDDRDLRDFLCSQDLIFVGGGNTANLLAVWRVHGLDDILREAWESGVVLAGGARARTAGSRRARRIRSARSRRRPTARIARGQLLSALCGRARPTPALPRPGRRRIRRGPLRPVRGWRSSLAAVPVGVGERSRSTTSWR